MAYIDESYTQDRYYIGAAIGDLGQWATLDSRLARVRAETAEAHGTGANIEFHGYEIMGGCGAWQCMRGKHREAAGVYRAVLREVREVGIAYIFRGVDVPRLHARYKYPSPPHRVVLGHLLERVNDYTRFKDRSGDQAVIVADEVQGQDGHLADLEWYREAGTPGYRPSKLDRLGNLLFSDSADFDGLQVADMAAYIYRRVQTIPREAHPNGERNRRRLMNEISPAIHHEWTWMP